MILVQVLIKKRTVFLEITKLLGRSFHSQRPLERQFNHDLEFEFSKPGCRPQGCNAFYLGIY